MKKLILGDGLFGLELQKQTNWDYISRKKDNIDFRKPSTYEDNCVGHVDVYSDDRQTHWDTNYKAVSDLVDLCNEHKKSLVHMSTDFVYCNSVDNASEKDVPVHPRNWYGYTKLLSDAHVQLKSNDFLLVRTSYKPYPFPYNKAWTSQEGNFDHVDVIAGLVTKLIEGNMKGVYNVGTKTKTMFDLAKQTNSEVLPSADLYHDTMPTNVTMNLGKLAEAL